MKYCTKEWYLTMQHTSMHLLLKPSERAAEFSEEYFQELYAGRTGICSCFPKSHCRVPAKPPTHESGH